MPRVTVKRSKRNPDLYTVKGGIGSTITVMGKEKADEIASARRRVLDRRKETKKAEKKLKSLSQRYDQKKLDRLSRFQFGKRVDF